MSKLAHGQQKAIYDSYKEKIVELKEENARLREALGFYADENNWETIETSYAELVKTLYPEDYGNKAREALERGEG